MPKEPNKAIGLERGVARLMEYQPAWAKLFKAESRRLRAAMGSRLGDIEHIGSTAIPGIPAKPILDIMAAVEDLGQAEHLAPDLAMLGYVFRPHEEVPGREYFPRDDTDGKRTHHLSLVVKGSQFWEGQLLFRDVLRSDARAHREYANLKRKLAKQYHNDRPGYVEAKGPFVLALLAKAQQRAGKPATIPGEEDCSESLL